MLPQHVLHRSDHGRAQGVRVMNALGGHLHRQGRQSEIHIHVLRVQDLEDFCLGLLGLGVEGGPGVRLDLRQDDATPDELLDRELIIQPEPRAGNHLPRVVLHCSGGTPRVHQAGSRRTVRGRRPRHGAERAATQGAAWPGLHRGALGGDGRELGGVGGIGGRVVNPHARGCRASRRGGADQVAELLRACHVDGGEELLAVGFSSMGWILGFGLARLLRDRQQQHLADPPLQLLVAELAGDEDGLQLQFVGG
mmetsp:Transcript_15594/g.43494  ORF Transcript_15594/g.43494 Transcript_15594/m.43494 type:complete len:252 (+) Transcript_15594:506-1261(+)